MVLGRVYELIPRKGTNDGGTDFPMAAHTVLCWWWYHNDLPPPNRYFSGEGRRTLQRRNGWPGFREKWWYPIRERKFIIMCFVRIVTVGAVV